MFNFVLKIKSGANLGDVIFVSEGKSSVNEELVVTVNENEGITSDDKASSSEISDSEKEEGEHSDDDSDEDKEKMEVDEEDDDVEEVSISESSSSSEGTVDDDESSSNDQSESDNSLVNMDVVEVNNEGKFTEEFKAGICLVIIFTFFICYFSCKV